MNKNEDEALYTIGMWCIPIVVVGIAVLGGVMTWQDSVLRRRAQEKESNKELTK